VWYFSKQSYLMKPMFQTMYDVLRPSFQQRKLISATFSCPSNVFVGLVTEHSALRSQMRHFEDDSFSTNDSDRLSKKIYLSLTIIPESNILFLIFTLFIRAANKFDFEIFGSRRRSHSHNYVFVTWHRFRFVILQIIRLHQTRSSELAHNCLINSMFDEAEFV